MLIFDSNVWIFQFTGTNAKAVDLLYTAIDRGKPIAVNAYILREVFEGFRSSRRLTGNEVDEAQQDLLRSFRETPTIEQTYTTSERYKIDLEEIRNTSCNKTLAMALGIQAKDAPIVSFACEYYNRSPTIYTNDRPFSLLNSKRCNLPNLTVEYIPNDGESKPTPGL